MANISEGLENNIALLEKQLATVPAGSEDQRVIAAALKELYSIKLNEEMNNAQYTKMAEEMETGQKELELKTETAKEDLAIKKKAAKDDKLIKIIGIAVPTSFSLIEMLNQNKNFRDGLRFEIENVVSSSFVRSMINTVMRKKK